MSIPVLVFLGFALVLAVMAEQRRRGLSILGLRLGLRQMVQMLPLIAVALLLAGMVEAIIPAQFVRSWLSAEAGFRGVGLGVVGGMVLAMGPYAAYPIIASVYGAGAGMGTAVSLLASWSLLNLSRVPFEAAFLGPAFTVRRMAIGIPYCLLIGSLAHVVQAFVMK